MQLARDSGALHLLHAEHLVHQSRPLPLGGAEGSLDPDALGQLVFDFGGAFLDPAFELRVHVGRLKLGAFALRDVFQHVQTVERLTRRPAYHGRGQLAPQRRAILAYVPLLDGVVGDVAREHLPHEFDIHRDVALVREIGEAQLVQLLTRVANDATQHVVGVDEAEIGADDRHTEGALGEHATEPTFAVA